MKPRIGALCALLFFSLLAGPPQAFAQVVPLVAGPPTVQNFDSLAASGTSATLPDGWYFFESGANANSTYAADDGSSNTGDTLSFGSNGSFERALGAVHSNSLTPLIGAQLRNDTGQTISSIFVFYTGEQWRRGNSFTIDALEFEYSTDATSLGDDSVTWVQVPALDFLSPVSGPSGPLNGNNPGNQTSISGLIGDVNLPASATIWVRWRDINVSDSDDGLAIEDVSFFNDASFAQVVSLVPGTPSVQDFDSLTASGTSSALPDGWYLAESGTTANSTYSADDGSSNTGDTYSFGSNGSSERALGTLISSGLTPLIGAKLRNDTGQTISSIVMSYTGEQWRRGSSIAIDALEFEYSTDAFLLDDDNVIWVQVPALDLLSPVSGPSGALDGNNPGNQTSISGMIGAINLPENATMWVRWRDINVSGSDDGLAIENVSFFNDGIFVGGFDALTF